MRVNDAEEREGTEEQGKSSFVTSTVVKTTEATKRFEKVGLEEAEGGGISGTEERTQEVVRFLQG